MNSSHNRIIISGLLTLLGMVFISDAAATAGKEILSVRIVGARRISEARLLRAIPLQRRSIYTPSLVTSSVDALLIVYRGEGFVTASVDSVVAEMNEDSSGVAIVFSLTEGNCLLLGRFSIHGVSLWTVEEVSRWCTTKTGTPLSQTYLETDIEYLLQRYENAGYPFARIVVDSMWTETGETPSLAVSVTVDEGSRIFLTEVSVEGNAATRSDVVTREARGRFMGLYREDQLEKLRRRIDHLGLFSSVEHPQLYLARIPQNRDSTAGGILIRVHEGTANTFDGVAGYVPSTTGTSRGYFTGNVTVIMRNLFGTGRRLSARWLRENEWTQELEAAYAEPWIAGYPVNGAISYYQRKQDSSYVKSRFDIHLEISPVEDFVLGALVQREDVYPSSSSTLFTVFESNVTSIGIDVRYDTRDNIRNPRSGVSYAAFYQRGSKKITGPVLLLTPDVQRDATIERISMDVEAAFPLALNHVIDVALHGREVSSSRLEQSDFYQLGGASTLRGYRENQFLGSILAWTNIEYRFLTGRLSSLFLLFDEGYVRRSEDVRHGIIAQNIFRSGYGVGARVETALGLIRLSYALGEGDSFSTGKIHFGIANDF
ncbi:MAG: BamA/TamA family outer membrane protein [Ignavibacteriales bacterium]|nr:BamA/TamA family outer membrane protein [Ignavibacteriales bacterium]